jgi:hypothetical protein
LSNCSHISRVKEWGFTAEHNFKAILWDCVLCGEISDVGWLGLDDNEAIDHTACDEDCFGCKARGLQLNTGDASSKKIMSNKKWNGELDAYRAARAQGIQPNGTSMAQVQAAVNASEVMGKAYDADTMSTPAAVITKEAVKSLGPVGEL